MTTYMQEELEACREERPINTDVSVCYDRWSILSSQKCLVE